MHLTLEVFFFSTVIKRGPRKEEGAHTTSLIHARARAHTRMERLGVGKRFCSYRCRSCLRVRRHVAAALLRQTEN